MQLLETTSVTPTHFKMVSIEQQAHPNYQITHNRTTHKRDTSILIDPSIMCSSIQASNKRHTTHHNKLYQTSKCQYPFFATILIFLLSIQGVCCRQTILEVRDFVNQTRKYRDSTQALKWMINPEDDTRSHRAGSTITQTPLELFVSSLQWPPVDIYWSMWQSLKQSRTIFDAKTVKTVMRHLFHQLSRRYHPDKGGSNELYGDLIELHSELMGRNKEVNSQNESSFGSDDDWNHFEAQYARAYQHASDYEFDIMSQLFRQSRDDPGKSYSSAKDSKQWRGSSPFGDKQNPNEKEFQDVLQEDIERDEANFRVLAISVIATQLALLIWRL